MSTAPDTAHGDVIDTDTPDTEPTAAPEPPSSAARRRLLWVVIALTLASAVFAGWAALGWWNATNDESLDLARTRDQVLIAAHTNIEIMSSLDHREIDAGVDAWLNATTGDFREQFANLSEENRRTLEEAGKVTTGRVVEAAVIDLSAGGDSASVIAAVELNVAPEEGEATVKRYRFTADMLRVDGDWKIAGLEQVPVVSP